MDEIKLHKKRLFLIFATEMEDLNLDIFNLLDKQPQPARGSMLVAKPTVEDICFKRSVSILIDHEEEGGSMGFIFNKPIGYTLGEVMPDVEGAQDVPLYLGGPVATNQLFFLHTLGSTVIPDSLQVAPGVFFGGDFEAVKLLLASGEQVMGKVKFMVGYSGWAPGQLDEEVKRHDWAVLKQNAAQLIFHEQDDNTWNRAVALFGEHYRMWSNWPTDVTMN